MEIENYAHDEDSLTNMFFFEVAIQEKYGEFLGNVDWIDRSNGKKANLPKKLSRIVAHQQVNFSEFGRPDVLLELHHECGEKISLVFVVVKLRTYLTSAAHNLPGQQFNSKINSKINNQISLRYRAAQALMKMRSMKIEEERHKENSPFITDKLRRCHKQSTCELASRVKEKLDDFYIVCLTADERTPFQGMNDGDSQAPLVLAHDPAFCNLGHIGWDTCIQILPDSSTRLSRELFFIKRKGDFAADSNNESVALEEAEESSKSRSRRLIRYENQICLLTTLGYSYRVRGIGPDGEFVILDSCTDDLDKYESLQAHIEYVDKPCLEQAVSKKQAWGSFLRTLN